MAKKGEDIETRLRRGELLDAARSVTNENICANILRIIDIVTAEAAHNGDALDAPTVDKLCKLSTMYEKIKGGLTIKDVLDVTCDFERWMRTNTGRIKIITADLFEKVNRLHDTYITDWFNRNA